MCHLLRSQVFLDRHGVIGAAFDGRVVADNHAIHTTHAANTRDDPRARCAVAAIPVRVHAQSRQRTQLQKRRAGVQQHLHPVTRKQFSPRRMAGPRHLAATILSLGYLGIQISHQSAHGHGIGLKIR